MALLPPRTLKIVGIHLAGPSTRKSAVVRTSVRVEQIFKTRLNNSDELSPIYNHLANALQINISESVRTTEQVYPPLFWEAFSPELGAQSARDADTRLLECISDLGQADIYCIDAPLTLPPCFAMGKLSLDQNNEVKFLKSEFENKPVKGKQHTKPALPYLDRFFEYHARSALNHPKLSGHFEFEAVLGSGRAPLTARAMYLQKLLSQNFPKAVILESNAHANLVGWAVNVGFSFPRGVDHRFGADGRRLRLGLFKKIEQLKYAARSANLHADLLLDMCSKLETFSAALSALSAWGLLNGHVYLKPEFSLIHENNPCLGWACVPLDLSAHAWEA